MSERDLWVEIYRATAKAPALTAHRGQGSRRVVVQVEAAQTDHHGPVDAHHALFPQWSLESRRDPAKRAALLETVSARLAARLAANPAFRAFARDVANEPHVRAAPGRTRRERVAASLLMQWESVGYRGDDVFELVFHDAATVAFDLADVARSDYREHLAWGAVTRVYAERPGHLGAIAAFLRAMYRATQADLVARGIRSLRLWRGEEIDAASEDFSLQTLRPRPLSSWTTRYEIAVMFAGLPGPLSHSDNPYILGRHRGTHGRVLLAEIPVERVLSTGWTGFGGVTTTCEVVTLAAPTDAWVMTRRQDRQQIESEEMYLAGARLGGTPWPT